MNDKQLQNRFLAFSGENIFKLNPASYTQEKMWAGIWNLCVRIFLLILLMMPPEDVRELYKDEFIQLYASSIKCFFNMHQIGIYIGKE